MEGSEVNALVHRVVMERLEGIPRPQRDGSLSPGYAPWTNSENISLPRLDLGRPAARASKHAPRKGHAWGEDVKKRALEKIMVDRHRHRVCSRGESVSIVRVNESKGAAARAHVYRINR